MGTNDPIDATSTVAPALARGDRLAPSAHEATTIRSHPSNLPGAPTVILSTQQSPNDPEHSQIARRCEARISFDYASGSGRYTAPGDSHRWFYGMLGGPGDPVIAAAERVIEHGLRACVPPGEWVYEYRPYLNLDLRLSDRG